MIQNLLLDPDNWDKVVDTMDKELNQYKDMLSRKDKEIAALQGQTLLLEQINNEVWLKEAESNRLHEETIRDLRENLERKETMFQTKEKKWAEVEKILVTYARKDMDLW